MNKNTAGLKITVCAAALAACFPALGQESTDKVEGGIQEVIVTASKRSESIQSVAMSVEAITAQTLQKQNIQKFEELEKLSPGLVLNPGDGRGQTVSLRGVTYEQGTGSTPTVQIYWNETPIAASDAFRAMFDIGRVEILRGPQGTLRGQASPAGSITVGTARPELDGVSGRFIQTFGSRSQRNTQAAVNVPVIDGKLAIRVAGMRNHAKDGIVNRFNGAENREEADGGRVSVLYQPRRDIEVLLVHQQMTSNSTNYLPAEGAPLPGQGNGPVLSRENREAYVDGNAFYYNKSRLTSLTASWEFADHKLSYIGGSQRAQEIGDRDLDRTDIIPGFANTQVITAKTEQTTHEMRLESTGQRRWNYMVGAYYSKTAGGSQFNSLSVRSFPSTYGIPTTLPLRGYPDPGNFTRHTALFTDHRFALTPDDQLQLGYRLQRTKKFAQTFIEVAGRPMAGLSDADAHQAYEARTASASYRHAFSKQVMAYVSYADGYRPGGIIPFNSVAGLEPGYLIYRPEKSQSIELGAKATLFQRRLVLNGAIFQSKIRDYIAQALDMYARTDAVAGEPAGPGPGGSYPVRNLQSANFTTNGDVLVRGVELSATWSIQPNWRAQASVAYTNAHYDNALIYCNDSNNDGVADTLGSAVQPGRQVSVCRTNSQIPDVDGNQAGKWSAVLQTEYSRPVGNYEGFVRALGRYTAPGYNPAQRRDFASYTPVDVYFGVRDPSQQWELSIWSQNLFDRSNNRPARPLFLNGQAGGYHTVFAPQERKVGVTLRYDFES